MKRNALALPVALLALAACAPHAPPPPAPYAAPWASPLERAHPLVGRIWDVREKRFVSEPALVSALAGADFVLLGEVHDNPDSHLLQAGLVRALVEKGRHPALAFEMLDADQQPTVDAALARDPRGPEAMATAVDWAHSGWPAFDLYRPVFAAGLDAGLPIVAADLSNKEARGIVQHGEMAVPTDLAAELQQCPLPEDQQRAWAEEMRVEHCGALPEQLLGPMVLAQRARDLRLARRMLQAADGRGAILVAGAGHVRTDRAVPAWLARLAPERRSVSAAFIEVTPGATEPAAYEENGRLPYDFVVFTPVAERTDPCEALRKHQR